MWTRKLGTFTFATFHDIPEREPSWEILMDLKEKVEIVVSTTLSEEILRYLESKISDHRQLLIDTFPDFKLTDF